MPSKTWNEIKQPEITQNKLKPVETTQTQPKRPKKKKIKNDPKRPNISTLGKSGIFY